MVGWDGKCENSALPPGLGLNAECVMPRRARPRLPSQAPGMSQRIIKSGHPRMY